MTMASRAVDRGSQRVVNEERYSPATTQSGKRYSVPSGSCHPGRSRRTRQDRGCKSGRRPAVRWPRFNQGGPPGPAAVERAIAHRATAASSRFDPLPSRMQAGPQPVDRVPCGRISNSPGCTRSACRWPRQFVYDMGLHLLRLRSLMPWPPNKTRPSASSSQATLHDTVVADQIVACR